MALCFGSYGQAIKKAKKYPKTNMAVAGILLSLITDNVEVTNQRGEPFDLSDKIASLYLNCKDHVLQAIVDASGNAGVVDVAEQYFRDKVITQLEPLLLDDLISDIRTIIESDANIPSTLKSEWITIADRKHLPKFLSVIFLYAIKKENKLSPLVAAASSDDIMKLAISELDSAENIIKKYPRPQEIPVPELPEDEEMEYIKALLAMYAEELKSNGTLELIDLEDTPAFKKDLSRRRKDYYAAETIREGTRDSFGDTEEANFSALKEDILDSVYDEYIKTHSSSMDRLNCVMSQAALSPANRSILLSKLAWISAREKKGVCHFLVKDGELKWVVDDG